MVAGMKTKAKIILTSTTTGIIAVETAAGDITVLEVLDSGKTSRGDVLIGYWTELGNQVVYNESRDTYLRVFVHNWGCELEAVQRVYFVSQPHAAAVREVPHLPTDDSFWQPSGIHSGRVR